jgi:hypothetical protein
MRWIAILMIVFLSACQNGEPLPEAQGPWFGLNAGQYQPTEADLHPAAK